MPTARPSIIASVLVVLDRPSTLPSPVISAMPRPTPITAVSSGSPAASSEPKVITRTTADIAMPIASAEPPASPPAIRAVPPMSTVRPASRACWAACSRASVAPVETLPGLAS